MPLNLFAYMNKIHLSIRPILLAMKALGFVCFGINSPRLIVNCNTSQTISSCFIRGDNDSYQTIAKTFTKGDSHRNKAGV